MSSKKFKSNSELTETSVEEPGSGFTCMICAEPSEYYAIGDCNHPICSICALRMRFVSKEKDCAVCKNRMEYMIVSQFLKKSGIRPFNSFGIFADSVLPGLRIDHSCMLYFYNCARHSKGLETLKTLNCDCGETFRNRRDLQRHLKGAHDGLQMCELCLDNLRLFVCEQILYDKKMLRKHLNETHPLCKFCNINLFDSMKLYTHMRDTHFTCWLCPAAHQHRFYKNQADVEIHLRNNHIVCKECFSSMPVGTRSSCAFRTDADFRDHMMVYHSVSLPANSSISVSFKFSGKGDKKARAAMPSSEPELSEENPNYLDLFMVFWPFISRKSLNSSHYFYSAFIVMLTGLSESL